ncbi:MAG: lysophospholipid acyltransferase family protein [Christensenellales bacterium]
MLYWFLYILCWLPIKILFPVKIVGRKNLIKGKALLCCNHQSNIDTFPILYAGKTKVYALCKKELCNTKFKAWFMKKMGAIPINRAKPEISAIKKCFEILNKNKNLLIFPQGTRMNTEEAIGIKEGVAMFALKNKAPIIPMVYLKKNKVFRKNTLVVGKPIEFDLDYNKENMQIVINTLEQKMNELIENKGEKQ